MMSSRRHTKMGKNIIINSARIMKLSDWVDIGLTFDILKSLNIEKIIIIETLKWTDIQFQLLFKHKINDLYSIS